MHIRHWSRLSGVAFCLLANLFALSFSYAAEAGEAGEAGKAGEAGEADGENSNLRAPKKTFRRFGRKRESLSAVLFPGVSPQEYEQGEEIAVWVDLVESKKTQVPFAYYDIPICNSTKEVKKIRKSLGAKLQGHSLKPAPYKIDALQNLPCTTVCKKTLRPKEQSRLRTLIKNEYRVHVTFDELPVLMQSDTLNYAVRGYPIGFKAPFALTGLEGDNFYIYNHINFTVKYSKVPDSNGVHIVGFEAFPVSRKHIYEGDFKAGAPLDTCVLGNKVINDVATLQNTQAIKDGDSFDVIYSYEVNWVESPSNAKWEDRWDIYMVGSPDDQVHYFAVMNSLMIVMFMTGVVASIMLRTLRKDIANFNELQGLDEAEDEGGWKLMHGDVFRPPQQYQMIFSVAVGTGAQIGTAIALVLLSALIGILSPLNKGHMLTFIIILYVLSGSVAGYCSSRLFKFFDGKAWKRNTMLTATAFPGLLVTLFVLLNIFLSFAGAATAVSFWTVLALFLLWVCVSAPLVFVGSFFGYKKAKIDVPVRTNQIARVVPESHWYTKLPHSFFLGGILPFVNISIELYFIMNALWLHQMYYIMGFLLVVIMTMCVACAEVSIVLCYIQLCQEDHRWWWKSFLNCTSCGAYLLLYSLWFLWDKLDLVGVLPTVVYLTYMSMLSITIALFCGSIGFFGSFWFVRTVYGALKVD